MISLDVRGEARFQTHSSVYRKEKEQKIKFASKIKNDINDLILKFMMPDKCCGILFCCWHTQNATEMH